MADGRKSRRSSILKPPKPRNPLSDVDLNPPSVDATFMKSRRVSFANSNFIKEFTADPEKNTIWHNSYEEVVNKSEDSKNNEHQTEDVQVDDFNCTRAEILDNSFETPLVSSPLEMSMCGSNIDLTSNEGEGEGAPPPVPVLNVNEFDEITIQRDRNAFMPSAQYATMFDQLPRNMEITGSIPANSNLMKNILKTKQQLDQVNKENEPYFGGGSEMDCLDFTQALPNRIIVENESMSECSMDITEPISTSITTVNERTQQQVDDVMELTQAIPDANKVKVKLGDDMDFTQAIPTCIKLNATTNVDHLKEMEFTQAIPAGLRYLINKEHLQEVTDNNMEFTQAIPATLKCLTTTTSSSSSNPPPPPKLEDSMEFTRSIPATIKLTPSDNMEFTCAIPANIKLTTDNIKCVNDDTNTINKSMEFTQAVPILINANTSLKINDNMEFTSTIPNSIKLNPIENPKKNDISMELTSAIPADIKMICNQNDNENKTPNISMEFTQTIPNALNLKPIDNDNNTANISMEFTQAIPNALNLKTNDKDNDNNTPNISMEFTQAIPNALNLQPNDNDNKNTSEMGFTQTVLPISDKNNISLQTTTNVPNISMELTDNKNSDLNESEEIKNDVEIIADPLKQINSNSNNSSRSNSMEMTTVGLPSILKLLDYSKKINDNENCNSPTIISIANTTEQEQDNIEINNTSAKESNISEHDTSTSISANNTNETECIVTENNENSEKQTIANLANIFHLKGYPLVISPASNETVSNKSDLCLRIKYANDDDDNDNDNNQPPINISQMEKEIEMEINNTTCEESNDNIIHGNKSSFVDCTEKLINYQINYEPTNTTICNNSNSSNTNESYKRQSTENICDISNIPRKIANDTLSDDSNNESINDNNVAWKSMVEKSYINNCELDAENVVLLNSLDGSCCNNSEQEQLEEKPQEQQQISITEYYKRILEQLKEAITYQVNVPEHEVEAKVENQTKSDEYRKRFEGSFKAAKPQQNEKTLNEKITEKSKDAPWEIVNLAGSMYTFNFMLETIVFEVHLAESTENVEKVDFYTQFCEETSGAEAVYVHNVLKKKLTNNYITSALGVPYTILSLLDLITMIGEQMLDILNEFDDLECRYGLELNKDLRAEVNFYDINLPIAIKVLINMKNVENICQDDLSVTILVGEIDENAIKKLIQGCPQDIKFLRNFILNVENYIKFRKTIKRIKH